MLAVSDEVTVRVKAVTPRGKVGGGLAMVVAYMALCVLTSPTLLQVESLTDARSNVEVESVDDAGRQVARSCKGRHKGFVA